MTVRDLIAEAKRRMGEPVRVCMVCRCALDSVRGDEPRLDMVMNGKEIEVTVPLCTVDVEAYRLFETLRQKVKEEAALYALRKANW